MNNKLYIIVLLVLVDMNRSQFTCISYIYIHICMYVYI
jgi:hypothetical protein